MLHCPNCHIEVKPEERFCGNCGARLPEQPTPPAPRVPTGKETIVLPPVTDPSAHLPAQPASDQTLLAAPPPVAPGQLPPTTPLEPTPGGYSGASLPPSAGAPPPAKSGSNIWKILGIIAGIGVLACIALAAGVYFAVVRPASNAIATAAAGGGEFATAAAGGLATLEALPTSELLSTIEALPTPDVLATIEPLATAAAGGADGAVLLRDEFTSANRSSFDEGESDNANYQFTDGAYVVTAKQPQLIVWQTARGDYGDVSIAVDATIEGHEQNAAALIFHYQDDRNFYIYTVTGDGRYSLDVYKDDELTTLIDWTEAAAINPLGQRNTLRVETIDDTIRLYVNDDQLDEITDATFSRGKAAIAINTFDEPTLTVTFDNLEIRSAR